MNTSISLMPGRPFAELIKIVKLAEEIGISKCYVNDEGINGKDPFVTLTALAYATHKIRMGTGFTNPFVRHPAITASCIVSLDEISNNRAFIGLTTGGTLTLGPLGIQPKNPVETLREMIVQLRKLFRGEKVSATGYGFNLCSAQLDHFRDGIEIWVAGRSPKMLEMAGELADGIVLGPVYKPFIGDYIDHIRKGADITGNTPKICLSSEIITSQREFEELKVRMASNIVDSSLRVKQAIGLSSDESDTIRNLIVNCGLSEAGKALKAEWIEPFVIMGSEAECEKELRLLIAKYKIDEFQIRISWNQPDQQLIKLFPLLSSIQF